MKWFRMYTSVCDDFKLESASDYEFRAWVKLLCLAASGDGKLPSIEEIAFRLRLTRPRADAVVGRLVELQLIDKVSGVLTPHNWQERQYRSDVSTQRVKEFRERRSKHQCERFGNVSSNSSETPSDTDTDTDTENTPKAPSPRGRIQPNWFAEFWNSYPLKKGKAAAERKYTAICKTGERHTEIMAGLKAQLPELRSREARFIPHPTTWLNQGRWEDEQQPLQPSVFDDGGYIDVRELNRRLAERGE